MTNSSPRMVPLLSIVIAVIAIVIFLAMGAPVDNIREIVIDEGLAYLAIGRQGIQIVDIDDPARPKALGGFGSIGEASGLAIQKGRETENGPRDYLYVADSSNGLIVLDVTDPTEITQVWRFDKITQAQDVLIKGNFAYVADGKEGLYVINIQTLPPTEPEDGETSYFLHVGKDGEGDPGLWKIVLDGKKIYALSGEKEFVLYDISIPLKSKQVHSIKVDVRINDLAAQDGVAYFVLEGQGLRWIKNPTAATTEFGSVSEEHSEEELRTGAFRNIAVYGIYAFVGRANNGIKMLDISDLSIIHSLVDEKHPDDDAANLVRNPTAIAYSEKHYIFVGDGRKGLNSIRINEKLEIAKVKQDDGNTSLVGSVEDVKVHFVKNDQGETETIIYMASCEGGVQTIRVRENKEDETYFIKGNPGCAIAMDLDGSYLVVAYRNKELRRFNISESASTPEQIDVVGTEGAANDVAVRENYAFVADGENGLQIIDFNAIVADQQRVASVGFGEGANAQGVYLFGDYAYVAAGGKGLQIVRIADVNNPETVGVSDIASDARAVFVNKPENQDRIYAYVAGGKAEGESGVWIIDVTDPKKPELKGRISTGTPVLDVAVDGYQLYFLQEENGLQIYNVKNPESPQVVSDNSVSGDYARLDIDKHLVYVAKAREGLVVYDVAPPETPEVVRTHSGAGILRNAVISGGYLYAVDGVSGLRVVDIGDPENLSTVDFYPTPGEASAVALDGGNIFIADGSRGFQIAQLDGGKVNGVGKIEAMDNARAIAASGNYVYIANGPNLVHVFDFSNPEEIKDKNAFHARGPVVDMAIWKDYLFLAEGGHGVQVLNIKDRPSPREAQFGILESEAIYNARSIEISSTYNYLYVADGEGGLKIYDISELANVRQIKSFDAVEGGSVAHVSLMGDYIFFLDEGSGGRVIFSPSPVDFIEMDDDNMADGLIEGEIHHLYGVDTSLNNSLKFVMLAAEDEKWLAPYKATKKINLIQEGWYETPGRASMRELLNQGNVPNRSWRGHVMFVAAGFGYFIATGIFLAIFATVILPVGSNGYGEAFRRLVYFLFGRHGPIVFVEDGKLKPRTASELREIGPGIVIADACSAAAIERRAYMPGLLSRLIRLLRTTHPREGLINRTSGPGIDFTRTGEHVHAGVDLHRQIRTRVGIKAHTRDGIEVECVVFALFSISEKPDVYKVTYEGSRKPENLRVVQLGKRDPVPEKGEYYPVEFVRKLEDILDIEDKYEIHNFVKNYNLTQDTPDEESDTPTTGRALIYDFEYNPRRVFSAAVVGRPYDVFENKQKDWTEAPIHVAVDVYRELLSQEMYDTLYNPDQQDGYEYQRLRTQFRTRVVNQGVLAFEYVERLDGFPILADDVWLESKIRKFPEQELLNRKSLRARGIKIITVGFTELKPSTPDIRENFLYEFWRAPWQQRSVIIQANHELQAMRIANQARVQSQRDMAFTLAQIMLSDERSRDVLAIRVFQALEKASADPATRGLLPSEAIYMLNHIRELLLGGDKGDQDSTPMFPPAEGGQ